MSKILTNPNSLVTVDALNYYADNNDQTLNPNDPVTVKMLAEFFELNSSNLTNPNSIVTVDTLNYYDEQKTPSIKSFSTATDKEITGILTAVRAGDISYDDLVSAGWTVGAERPVSLSAMEATGVGESHVAQNQTWVILHGKDFFNLDGGGKNLFVVGLKNCLADGNVSEGGYINSTRTNSGGWYSCNRRIWCDNVFKNSIPTEELNWFRKFKYKRSNGNGSTSCTEMSNYFTLPSMAEVFNTSSKSGYSAPSDEGTKGFDYYNLSDGNKKKYPGDNSESACYYWLSSCNLNTGQGANSFLEVASYGGVGHGFADFTAGLSPYGCF